MPENTNNATTRHAKRPTITLSKRCLSSWAYSRLDTTDKYLLADFPIRPEGLSKVMAYRQALRDLPDQPGAPWDGGGAATPWPVLATLEV